MKKNKRIIFATMAALSLAAPMTAVFNFDNVQTVSANHQGTKIWLQYGTLKYALKGPSGRVYPAGTKVVRELSNDNIPPTSLPSEPFYLTLLIGGLPGMETLQDFGGGEIAQAYVNYEDWHEIDYPSDEVVLVQNTEDPTDLASSDFHPVDSSNPDVPHANVDKLRAAYNALDIVLTNKITKQDQQIMSDFTDKYFAATAMGVSQDTVDKLITEMKQALAYYKKTGHLAGYDSSNSTDNIPDNSNDDSVGSSTATSTSKSRVVRLRKASYRYTRKGKRVSKKLLKKGSYVKINGKTYHIKGKTFYRIAKNRYIRKVNVAK
ncbi:putative bacterial surface layer protein [Lactobacillus kullabergensis]|uniref:Putative bacterial surface layer protein n=1 Tax=Lactobacillus kullabergensis TaxID=1218493 RepID=A0A0F4LJM0_9LACO|nr:SLAP domain-containing protein [Lactobacillus kullabergensis]KJY59042.1 putative bacterial surface layer protein [Lactobacillus kullabergensis]